MHNNQFLSMEVKLNASLALLQIPAYKEEFENFLSTVSIHRCILKPYLLVFYHRINFYWEFFYGESGTPLQMILN